MASLEGSCAPKKRFVLLITLTIAALLAPWLWPPSAGAAPGRIYRYEVRGRDNRSDLEEFASKAAETYADPRGWNLGGSIEFDQVPSGGDFTLWLAAARDVPRYSGICSKFWSCTVGRNVIINEDRWLGASPAWNASGGALRDYEHMVVNHETGHWLGFHHDHCSGPGQPAPVMQQQSKGLEGCAFNPWPLAGERLRAASARGLTVQAAVPATVGFAAVFKGSSGYWTVRSDGTVTATNGAPNVGDLRGKRLAQPIVGIAHTASDKGYWLVGSDGGVYNFGDAPFLGSLGGQRLNQPIVGIASTPDGKGFWLVARDGGIFSFGTAKFYGSTGALHLQQPIVGMSGTDDGKGYWMVAGDGGIFSFGSAAFYGSTGGRKLTQPVVGMASTPEAEGYWIVTRDGTVYNFGDAPASPRLGAGRQPAPTITGVGAGPYGFGATDSTGNVFWSNLFPAG